MLKAGKSKTIPLTSEGCLAPTSADSETTEYEVVFMPTDATNYTDATTKVKLTVNIVVPGVAVTGIDAPVTLTAELTDRAGETIYARQELRLYPGDWQTSSFTRIRLSPYAALLQYSRMIFFVFRSRPPNFFNVLRFSSSSAMTRSPFLGSGS